MDQNLTLSGLLAAALQSDDNIVIARATASDRSQIVFAVQVLEVTVDGVTESLVDVVTPPKSQLN